MTFLQRFRAPGRCAESQLCRPGPEIEVFLKEHLFAELFERDVLTYAERELATVAIIASLGKGVEPMLKGHMGIALNVGVTPDELRGVLAIIERISDVAKPIMANKY